MKKPTSQTSKNARPQPTGQVKKETSKKTGDGKETETSAATRDFEALLDYLQRTRGFDFAAYKRTSLQRRILKRMQDVSISTYGDYIDYLEVHPEEFGQLFNTILINVTAFFRDEGAWEYLAQEIIPAILEHKPAPEPVRIWTAGCAAGQEAYTLAILFAEALGATAFRERVKIYGTDADEEALNQARLAAYTDKQVEDVPPALLKKYFDRVNGRYVFNKDLRRCVIFGRHDLIQDAPISRVDLIVCRNTLMYFNSETQTKILARFGFGLNDRGYLFLGKAEVLITRLSMFAPVDVKCRIFSKIPRSTPRERLIVAAQGLNDDWPTDSAETLRLREAAVDVDPLAQILLDLSGHVVLVNEAARILFGLNTNDIGRPLQDLEVSYRPVELRSHVEQAYLDRRPVTLKEVEWTLPPPSAPRYEDVSIIPVFDIGGSALGVKIIFTEVTRFKHLQEELQQSRQELETAYEELQSTNEELETTNEELQSTNEELETMNEELQSTNEELEATNEQLRQRTEELAQANSFSDKLLASLMDAVVVVGRDLDLKVWNRRAEDLWGLRADEVLGKHLFNLDFGLPVHQLRMPIRAILTGEAEVQEVTLPARNRRGNAIEARITITPLGISSRPPEGVILMMEERRLES